MLKNSYPDLYVLGNTKLVPKFLYLDKNIKGISAKVVIFNDIQNTNNEIIRIIKTRYKNVNVTYASGHLEKQAYKVRNKLTNLVAKAKKIKIKNKSLVNYLAYKDKFSLWWISEIFHKRSYKFRTFSHLCQIEYLKTSEKLSSINRKFVISDEMEFKNVMEKFLNDKKTNLKIKKFTNKFLSTYMLFKYSAIFINWFLKFIFIVIILKLFLHQKILKNRIAFFQFCTAYFTKKPFIDDKFGKNNSLVKSFNKNDIISICSIYPDNIHDSISPLNIFSVLSKKKSNEFMAKNIFILEKYISFKDIFNSFLKSLSSIFRFSQLAKNSNFINHWKYDNIDISPFIMLELNQTIRRVPRFITYIERVSNFTQKFLPQTVVYNMFETPIGKSTVFGVRLNNKKTKIIATQDGPICRLKLETSNNPEEIKKSINKSNYVKYIPLPDIIFLDGPYAKKILLESGYSKEMLIVTGSIRMMGLLNDFKSKNYKSSVKNTKLLVAFSQNDHSELLRFCYEFAKTDKRCSFIFKTHPRGQLSDRELEDFLERNQFKRPFKVSKKNLWKLFNDTEFVLGTFTSVLDEAAIIGKKVISIQFGSRVNTSPLMDLKFPWIKFVSNVSQLKKIVYKGDTYKFNYKKLLKARKSFYFRTDSSVEQNWKKQIYNINR